MFPETKMAKRRVHIVDDEPEVRNSVAFLLSTADIESILHAWPRIIWRTRGRMIRPASSWTIVCRASAVSNCSSASAAERRRSS